MFVKECRCAFSAGFSGKTSHYASLENDTADQSGLVFQCGLQGFFILFHKTVTALLYASIITHLYLQSAWYIIWLNLSMLFHVCYKSNFFLANLLGFFCSVCLEVYCRNPRNSSLVTQMNKQWKLSPKSVKAWPIFFHHINMSIQRAIMC